MARAFQLSPAIFAVSLKEFAKLGAITQFVARLLPADFVQRLTDDHAAIAAVCDDQETSREGVVGSTANIGQLIGTEMKEVPTST